MPRVPNAPLKTVLSAKFSLPSNFNLEPVRISKKTSFPLLACYLLSGTVQFVLLQFAILLKQIFSFVFKTCALRTKLDHLLFSGSVLY